MTVRQISVLSREAFATLTPPYTPLFNLTKSGTFALAPGILELSQGAYMQGRNTLVSFTNSYLDPGEG